MDNPLSIYTNEALEEELVRRHVIKFKMVTLNGSPVQIVSGKDILFETDESACIIALISNETEETQ